MESITLFDWLVFNWGLPCLSPSKNQPNKQIISVVLLSVLEGVYTWNFIPGWNSSWAEIIPVYGEMSLTVYTFLPRWNFIPGWKKEKRRVNTSSRDEILKWGCFFNFWFMYSNMFSKVKVFEHKKCMNIMKHETSL